ncbi:holo-ACP synthase [Candidatus Wolfebacteria bacterium]|nr:MAG: holo-ACP synthase [Candidatus Wolfebacteria bacterium]
MIVKTGCDIVDINRFERSMKGRLDTIFSPHELAGAPTIETLAGLFAAKEAVIKALEMKAGDWQEIEIVKNKSGRPEAKLLEVHSKILSHDISISHDGDYAIAVTIFFLNQK